MKVAVFFPKVKSNILTKILTKDYPDKLSSIPSFNKFGMEYQLFDPLPSPINPMGNKHSLYSGIDPLRAILFAFKKNKFDIILCVGESSALVFIWLKKIFKLSLPPIVVWDPALTLEWKNRVKMLHYVLPNVACVAVLGKNQQYFIEQNIGKCNTAVLPHWIDCNYFSQTHCITKKENKYILAVGDDVSRDYALLETATKDLSIKIIIVSRKFKPNPSSNITVISEFLSFSDLRQLYYDSLFVVVPLKNVYHAGGINAIQEAMAMKKATIVSDSEGVREYINDSTSIIVQPENIPDLKHAILTLLNNYKQRSFLGKNSRIYAEEFYSCDVLAEKFHSLFHHLLTNNRSR